MEAGRQGTVFVVRHSFQTNIHAFFIRKWFYKESTTRLPKTLKKVRKLVYLLQKLKKVCKEFLIRKDYKKKVRNKKNLEI